MTWNKPPSGLSSNLTHPYHRHLTRTGSESLDYDPVPTRGTCPEGG